MPSLIPSTAVPPEPSLGIALEVPDYQTTMEEATGRPLFLRKNKEKAQNNIKIVNRRFFFLSAYLYCTIYKSFPGFYFLIII